MYDDDTMMPGAPAPMQQPYVNPLAANILAAGQMAPIPTGAGQMSVLADDARQQKLGQLWDETLDSQFKSLRANKGEQIATDIFGKIVGPAMAAFGGLGTGAGGLELIQHADQDLARSRLENRQKLTDTGTLLNQVTNIVDRTSPNSLKALAQEHKAKLDAAKLQEKAAEKASSEQRLADKLGMSSDQFKMKLEHEKNKLASLDKFRDKKLGLDEKRINQYTAIQTARIKLQDQQFKIAREMQQYGIDSNRETQMARLQAELQKFNVAEERLRNHLNEQIQEKMRETSGGVPKYPGLQGIPLEGAEVNVSAPELAHPEIQAGSQVLQELEAELAGQPAAAAPGTVAAPPATAATGQPKAKGQPNLGGAWQKLQQILNDPKAPAELKKKAAGDYEIFLQRAGKAGGSI